MTSPISVELPLKIATWAQRTVAGPRALAFAVYIGLPDDEIAVIAELTRRARALRGAL